MIGIQPDSADRAPGSDNPVAPASDFSPTYSSAQEFTPAVPPALTFPASAPARRILPVLLWSTTGALLLAAAWLLFRSCSFDVRSVGAYGLYFAGSVFAPGLVCLRWITGRPLSWTWAIALGVPTGFALEILVFLSASALGLKVWLPVWPVASVAAAVAWGFRSGGPALRWRLSSRHAGVALALSALFLVTVVSAVSQMFSEAPLVTGLPQRPIFHDWVYLVSRAAAIKEHWPIEDPSLAGTPLSYHYFMMVHAAAASWSARLEVTLVLLRLMIIPLGAVLVVQAYLLGRWLGRSPVAGLWAALLTVCASGVSFRPDYERTDFLDLFSRWLYVSPTFYFGVIFFGALLFAVGWLESQPRLRLRAVVWLGLLAAAGTGAKGTVLPVLLLGLGIWMSVRWWRSRRLPARQGLIGAAMALCFGVVYVFVLSAWGAGTAEFDPFRVYHLTQFWQEYAVPCQRALKRWLDAPDVGTWLGALVCALGVFAGTAGVRLLALPYLLRIDPRHRAAMAAWLGAAVLASFLMGSLLHFDSNGELYLILLMRLPLAVLAGAALASGGARLRVFLAELPRGALRRADQFRLALLALIVVGLGSTLLIQSSLWFARSRRGFADWLAVRPDLRINDDLVPMYEAMLWLRANSERHAVVVANAFTEKNLKEGRGVLVDHTTAGVHYYYSALSERHLWIEGPSYQLDLDRSRQRLALADRLFYRGYVPSSRVFARGPVYVLLDHAIGDGARLALPERHRVFSNGRFEVYRLPREAPVRAAGLPGAE